MASIDEYAWFVRDMPAAASCALLGSKRVYAGDWDGNLRAWSADGTLEWEAKGNNRVEQMCGARSANPPFICATTGGDLLVINAESGETKWNKKLVGSSDLVTCTDDGSRVVATSSVYELELNDFVESTCWRFDADGKSVREDTFDERPWHLLIEEDARVTMGLGRPRCGIMIQNDISCDHLDTSSDDPILSGVTLDGRTYFGHASGSFSILGKDGVGIEHVCDGVESVLTIAARDGLVVGGGDDGIVHALKGTSQSWSTTLHDQLDESQVGFKALGTNTVWISTWNGLHSTLHILSGSTGESIVEFPYLPRVRSIAARDDRVAVCLDDGRLVLFKSELFERRLEHKLVTEDSSESDPRRSALQEKLRSLRR